MLCYVHLVVSCLLYTCRFFLLIYISSTPTPTPTPTFFSQLSLFLVTSSPLPFLIFSLPVLVSAFLLFPFLFFYSVRESAASVVVTFITTYPLGAKRVTAHMKQMISNCSYVYEDGRQSSFEALATLVRLLPLPLLEDHAASVFLPMTLRLVSE